MEPHSRQILDYITADSKESFREWLKRLRDTRARNLIRIRINRVQEGNLGDHGPVGNGVSELRLHFGPGYRVYFGTDGDKLILLGGGDKSTQTADIRKVQERWRDYHA